MVRRVLLILGTILLYIILGLVGVVFVALRGPSHSVRDQLTLSMLETSAMKMVPGWFLPSLTVDAIIAGNTIIDSGILTDTSLVTIYRPEHAAQNPSDSSSGDFDDNTTDEWADYPEGIRIEYVRGSTYRGYVMLIRDPSRVYTAVSSNFRSDAPGLRINEAKTREGAVAAINGGGFPDVNGVGLGNIPIGMVFSKGELLWGGEYTTYSGVMGFDENDVLIVGSMTPRYAREIGIRDAICFGPILVVNGEPAEIRGASGGLNPRSAIGQRADGTVIFLCIDGRMPSSMGANYQDLIEIMMDYGAINAANLDGGSSSHLLYNNEIINISSSLYGPRRLPTFFMVRPLEG